VPVVCEGNTVCLPPLLYCSAQRHTNNIVDSLLQQDLLGAGVYGAATAHTCTLEPPASPNTLLTTNGYYR
jgi:hypothetical protein